MIIYIATPYSHPDPNVVKERMNVFARVAGTLALRGYTVVSPCYNHFILDYMPGLATDWHTWRMYSEELLSKSHRIVVLCQDRWEESIGVRAEIGYANQCKIPIIYMSDFEATSADALFRHILSET